MNDDLCFAVLERRTRMLERWLRLSIVGWVAIGVLAVAAFRMESKSQQPTVPASLKVSELVVVDSKGVERVRIGGDLPDATYNGKRVPRGSKAAGVLLYDSLGRERGGYVTWEAENVGLTLDSPKMQVGMFLAGQEGSALHMRYGKDSIEFRSDEDGSRLTAVQDGKIVLQQPNTIKMSKETCDEYRGARARFSAEQVMRDCQSRFIESVCKPCLEHK